ncbi:MAG: response regulator [Actinobacteria bacterium]|nr:response regulator [Actinomycetota bacterium]
MANRPGAVDFGTEAVMVVDDEAGVRRFLSRTISSAGHAVESFGSADEAFARVRPGVFAVAFVDLRMPGHDGLWFYSGRRTIGD